MDATVSLTVLALSVVITIVVFVLAVAVPSARSAALYDDDGRPRVRLLSRLLFTGTRDDAITVDCLLLSVEQAGPGITAPEGLPFTLQLRVPATACFASRVDQLLNEWADDSRELIVELREDNGKVRTIIASGASSVHLELCGAAGLSLSS